MDPTSETKEMHANREEKVHSNKIWVFDTLNNWVCLEDPIVECKTVAVDHHEVKISSEPEVDQVQASSPKE